MVSYRSHAASNRNHRALQYVSTTSPAPVPRQQQTMSEVKKNVSIFTPAFLAWPFYFFEKLMNPWRGNITSVVSQDESWRVGNRITIPKSESRETPYAYHYLIELPHIECNQIELNIKDGTIMLQVETTQKERGLDRYYRHSHSIRRAFSLPVYTDASSITAELKNDVLEIIIPKTDNPVAPKAPLNSINIT
jgi:HSP20 family molecular chaperone IbpA